MPTSNLDLVRRIGAASRWLTVVATCRPDGSIHASLVNAGVLDDPVTGEPAIAMVVRGDARKLAHFRRYGRAAATFHHGWEWVSVEGPVRIAGSDPELLRAVFKAAGGTHDDWAEYDRVMAEEGRVAVFIDPTRVVTNS